MSLTKSNIQDQESNRKIEREKVLHGIPCNLTTTDPIKHCSPTKCSRDEKYARRPSDKQGKQYRGAQGERSEL